MPPRARSSLAQPLVKLATRLIVEEALEAESRNYGAGKEAGRLFMELPEEDLQALKDRVTPRVRNAV